MSLLKVDDIHVYYGAIHAIKGISLEVHEDEVVTLIGANGAGKSSTLNTIAGLLKPRQGTIAFEDKVLNGLPASKIVPRGMALCPEGRRIFQQMTVPGEPGNGRLHPAQERNSGQHGRNVPALPPAE